MARLVPITGAKAGQPIEMAADGLPDTPLDTVAHHGLAQGAGQRKTNVRTVGLRFPQTESREELILRFRPIGAWSLELLVIQLSA